MIPLYCLLISYESCCQQTVSLALHNDCKSSWKPLTGLLSSDSRKPLHTHAELKCWIEHLAFILFLACHKQTWHNMYAVEQLALLELHFWKLERRTGKRVGFILSSNSWPDCKRPISQCGSVPSSCSHITQEEFSGPEMAGIAVFAGRYNHVFTSKPAGATPRVSYLKCSCRSCLYPLGWAQRSASLFISATFKMTDPRPVGGK